MASDFGMKVSRNGVDAKVATGNDLILTSQYPLAKIDSTKKASFQNIRIQFNNNIPLQTPTIVYQFAHGYNYTPTVWSLCQIFGIASPYKTGWNYLTDDGPMLVMNGSFGPVYAVTFWTEVDATNVYFYLYRWYDQTIVESPNINVTIAGMSLRIRTYVFAEDIPL